MADQDAHGQLEVHVLGPIRATVGGRDVRLGGPRQQALLAVLASRAGHTVANDVIVDAIWDGDPPGAADRTFRSYVARLRRALDWAGLDGSAVVRTESGGYRLDGAAAVDAALFEEGLADARTLLEQGELAAAVRRADEALERWEGPAYGWLADRSWAAPDAVRLEELRLVASELRARALLGAGRVQQAVVQLEELAVDAPYREAVARLHAVALHRDGRDADALATLRGFRARLAEEHGLDPSEQLVELETMILDHDPRLDRPVSGRRVRGYVLHEPIARSPLGTVHRAEQPSIGREVAVTVLAPEHADDPDVVRAFEARLQAVADLDHPHVLPVYDYWREPGGAYVVTRLPSGTLEQRQHTQDLEVTRALRLGRQVASALAAAHERGVVHGAVGPDAIVVDTRGDAFLWAFPLTGEHDRPADDVTALATLLLDRTTSHDGDADADVALPPPVGTLLRRAADPDGGPVVTAAALASGLAATGDGRLEVPAVPVEAGPNPYRGLAAFRETDTDVFFGREALTEQLLARVHGDRAVAVVGPSGSGKSSVVRAGLLPPLRAEGAFVTTMVPGTRPLAELEVALCRVSAVPLADAADEVVAGPDGLARLVRRALPTPGQGLVLVVDQFEELFTLSDPTEADLFLAALHAAVNDPDAPVRAVLTLRADLLGPVLEHPTAGPLVRDRSVLVAPMGSDELHEVVTRPAEVAGVTVEPALATAIVADASRAPGSLPLVQFALTETFAAAQDGLMSLVAYRRIGGIEGVLGQRAEEVFAGLDDDGQQAAHRLFKRLVAPASDGPPTRRRALRSELERVADDVIEAFGDARLLRFDHDGESREPTVEVTHEAMFGAWARLAAWIEEEADELRVLGHLSTAAAEWDAGGRQDTELYRGSRLATALAFAGPDRGELAATERAFLDRAQQRRAEQEAASRRNVRRLRVLTAGLAVGLVLALVGGGLAFTARQEAQVDALAFAATGELGDDPERASLLAAHAYALDPDLESQAALLDVLDVEPRILSLRATPSDTCSEPTGAGEQVLFTTLGSDGEALELRTLDQDVLRRWPDGSRRRPSCTGITPSGRHLFQRYGQQYSVMDLERRRVGSRSDVLAPTDLRSMDLHPSREEAALVLDTGQVAVVTLPSLLTVRVLDLELGLGGDAARAAGRGGGRAGESLVRAVAYSEDGSLLAVADANTVHVVDDTGALLASAPASTHPGGGVLPFVSAGAGVFGHLDERALVVTPLAAPDRTTHVATRGRTTPHGRGVAVETDGRRAAVATELGIEVITLVDLPPGGVAASGRPVPVDVSTAKLFWSDEGRLNGAGPNGVLQLDVDRTLLLGGIAATLPEHDDRTAAVADVAADGSGVLLEVAPDTTPGPRRLVFREVRTGPGARRLVFRDVRTGEELRLGAAGPAAALPGGRWLAVDPDAGVASVGDVTGATGRVEVPGLAEREQWSAATSVTGDRVAVLLRGAEPTRVEGLRGEDVFLLALFDADSGELVGTLEAHAFEHWTAAVPVGGDRVLVANLEYEWEVLDLDRRTVQEPRVHGAGPGVAAVDVATGRYVTADWNGDLHVVDPASGEVVDIAGPASPASNVAFTGDDRLVSTHLDGSTHLWDIPSRTVVGRLWQGPSLTPWAIAVDRARDDLLQVTPEGVARIPLDPDAWFATVCSRVDRQLSERELAAVAPGLGLGPGCPA